MKLRHLAAAVGAASLLAVGLAAPAFAQDRKPVDIKAEKACGAVTLTFVNPTATQHGFRWNAVAGDVATADGARTGLVTVAAGATVKETIRFAEDEFSGSAAVTLAYAFGQDSDIQPTFPGVYPVDTDCDGKPPVTITYPADCEIGAGVDNGESGKQADADAPCVSNSPGYERDEVGKQCDVTSGEIGGGDGVVTEALKCEAPVTEEPPTQDPPAWDGATSFGDGLYQVGRDIPAGLYRTPGDGGSCYWARLSANDGSLDSIIANDFFDGPSSMTIAATDKFVSFSSGCVWTLDGHEPTDPGAPPAPPVSEENEDNDSDGSTDNGGSDNGSVDDGLNPGPITSSNGETVTVPSGGVETGGGPA